MHNITLRELMDLEAHLRLEGTNITTFNHYSRECQDPQLKSFCQDMSQRRMQAFQMLANNLSGSNYQ
ncbi:MAG: hypothetical protein FH758_00890 [Firmicutes bacterium]|nr:hypothetical protein [Bacillota bacterium]